MRLLVIRHGIAKDRKAFAKTGQRDALRPLTQYGRTQMRESARGLKRIVPTVNLVVTSPLARTVQTAKLVGEMYGLPIVKLRLLDHDPDIVAFVRWLRTRPDRETVAAVGHEMHLATLVSWLLSGRRVPFLTLKKGGACLLEFEDAVARGRAQLLWSLTPAHLRAIGA